MLIKRKELEIFLAQLEAKTSPNIQYEQYSTPPRVAANMLWFAAVENNDIFGKNILDLGCGSGILSLGAAFLGAKGVIGIDIDFKSLTLAKKNSRQLNLSEKCEWICSNAETCLLKNIDTVIMNPPFGMRKESTSRDRTFLKAALASSNTVYSFSSYDDRTREFFKHYSKELGARVEQIIQMDFEIKKQYDFHKKEKHIIVVDMYLIKK